MFKFYSYKPRKLFIRIDNIFLGKTIEKVKVTEDNFSKTFEELTEKYNTPIYDFKIIEILDYDWEE